MQWFTGLGPSRLATRRALYSQFRVERVSNQKRRRLEQGWGRLARLPDFQWPSINPYEPPGGSVGLDPELVTEAVLRKAFAAIDADDDGVIATEDLITAIEQAMEADGGGCNVEMLRAMVGLGDLNKDGVIDFDEYKRIIAADPGFFDPSLVEKDGRKAAMTG
jgi:hypothetical protein